ncbi:MAG: hypothetical protein JRI33_00585 [Deltaproteobacteria bacterium]|nr:hypothetical protein [Deltaproteobacteria bacterium]
MYAVIEKNRIKISVAEFYNMAWYEKDRFLEGKEKYEIDYGSLEIDLHSNGKKYLTGFVIDPREFIVDYLWNRYKGRFSMPKRVQSVAVDTGPHTQILSVDFLKARSFVVDGMEKDLIFPQFCRRRGENVIQGFEVLSLFSIFRYLAGRFNFRETTLIRQGNEVYDFKGKPRSRISLGKKREDAKK